MLCRLGGTVDDPGLSARPRGHKAAKRLNPEDGPFVTFVFRYRPAGRPPLARTRAMCADRPLAALLQADGIMPLPASAKGKGRAGPSAGPTGNVKAEPSLSSTGAGASQVTASSDIIELTDDEDDVSVG